MGKFSAGILIGIDSMNTFTHSLIAGLTNVFENLIPNSGARAVLIRANGRSFCAGGNVADMGKWFTQMSESSTKSIDQFIITIENIIAKIYHCPLPVIGQVHGSVVGAGVGLMLACDIIIAAEDTQIITGYTKIGLNPDGGTTFLLPRSVGPRKALELFYTSEALSANQALKYGMINHVVSADNLSDHAEKLANKLAHGPTLAYEKAKKLVHQTLNNSLEEQFEIERPAVLTSFATEDFKAGVMAFIQKEKPHFTGK